MTDRDCNVFAVETQLFDDLILSYAVIQQACAGGLGND